MSGRGTCFTSVRQHWPFCRTSGAKIFSTLAVGRAGTPDWLVRNGARVVAIDRSSRMVRLADERLGGRARVMQGDVSNLRNPLLSETFDVILSSSCFTT